MALLGAFSLIAYVRVRSDRLRDLDASLVARATGLAALVERDHGVWEADFAAAGPSGSLVGTLSGWAASVHPSGPVLGRGGAGGSPDDVGDGARLSVPEVTGIAAEGSPRLLATRLETAGPRESERRLAAVFLVFSEDADEGKGDEGLDEGAGEEEGDGEDEEDRGAALPTAAGATALPAVGAGPPGPALVRVDVAQDLGPLARDLSGLLAYFGAAAAVLGGMGFLAGHLLSRRIVDPLEHIARRAESVRAPSDQPPLALTGAGDEVDRLAATLNATFLRLNEAWSRTARFTADASHELRTPLAAIRSQAEVALRRERAPAEYREALDAVSEEARRMQDTLEGLLLLARADAGVQPPLDSPVDLAEVARAAVASVAANGPGPSLRLEAPVEVPVLGDARQLEVLVRNLLLNAVRHTPPSGQVVVRVTAEGTTARLDVRDTGEGIAAEALPHVFDRFYRADASRDRDRGGAGLGLSIVEAIARSHRGTVRAASRLGEGSTFVVRLPRQG